MVMLAQSASSRRPPGSPRGEIATVVLESGPSKGRKDEAEAVFGRADHRHPEGGLVLPFCNTDTMNLHLAEIALHVAPGAHAVVLMDQAGWHLTPKLELPANISIVAIPSKSPELNPQENVWQFMRDNWLSNRVFGSYDEIVDHCCDA
ncbi:hypothetical protein FOY91_20935 [Sphingomonas solaris]|uniref:Tc1-like transposase DDE domain-containing protein n=1 Tax=Alterirhizorhabdus solaris TaxID=2529389 RepID=A0A558QRI1_9SPHN|nr:hypothetical protein FOY91_20935 [Sphingomonas solaris]